MSRFKIYINPFDVNGDYTEFIDATEDVDFNKMNTLSEKIDNSKYDVGIFNFHNVTLTLRNEHGKYDDIDGVNSIFKYSRTDSQLKITWQISDDLTQCGNFICGAAPANLEVELYRGLITDESFASDISKQTVKFQALGLGALLRSVDIESVTISVGDLFSAIIYNILNQSRITDLLTVDAGNITVGTDQQVDVVTEFNGKTVKEVLDEILRLSNSILTVKDQIVYVTTREETADLKYTFYGQASNNGIENISKISVIKSGLDRTFNYWVWQNTTLAAVFDASSKAKYGTRKNSVAGGSITDPTKRTAILTELNSEFKLPQKEFDLTAPLDYQTLELAQLDKVQVDYPTPYIYSEDSFPVYGGAIYGQDRYPFGEYGITINESDRFKIMGRKVDLKTQMITFSMRQI